MTKKILKISAYILIILAVVLLGYYYTLSQSESVDGVKKPFFGNLFPFGNNNVVVEEVPFATTPPDGTGEPQVSNFEQVVRLISNEPVAGSVFVSSTTKRDVVRYIEKATGHIFDVPTYESSIARISNTTIPQIYETKFTENGAGFIAQYIKSDDVVETMYGKISGVGSDRLVTGTILSRNITSVAVSPDGKNIFTLEKVQNGSEGYFSLANGTGRKLVWSSPLREFIPQFIGATHVGLQSKPYVSAQGVLFDVNTVTAGKSVLIGNQLNLTTLPNPRQNHILYSNGVTLFDLNTTNNVSNELSPNTFPEKCVWAQTKLFVYCAVPRNVLAPSSLYAWYKGEISFSDDIWEYDIVANTARRVVDLENLAGRSIDVSTISINQADTLLLIQNKTDGSLWTVKTN